MRKTHLTGILSLISLSRRRLVLLALLVSSALLVQVACRPKPGTVQEKKLAKKLKGYYKVKSWTQGTRKTALRMALAGTTIPMVQYSFVASKDNSTRSGMLVGTSPFATPLKGSTVDAVLVPLKISIGSVTFDPDAPDPCNNNVSAVQRFRQSPLVNDVENLTMNGVNLGNVQFINGLRRAEFWSTIHGSPTYQNELRFSFANAFELTSQMIGSNGITDGSGCEQIGVVSSDWLDSFLQSTVLPSLTRSGVVSPRAVVFFLLKNVVQSDTGPVTLDNCCILGFHNAVGIPVQTYGTIAWNTSTRLPGVPDASVASHEIGEWMDDPLGNNPTPPWGNVGQVKDCQDNWEVGDPLSGTLMPPISINGQTYEMQELGFFSWFFNNSSTGSVGAGGKFSSNGTFQGPSKLCPPGGTN